MFYRSFAVFVSPDMALFDFSQPLELHTIYHHDSHHVSTELIHFLGKRLHKPVNMLHYIKDIEHLCMLMHGMRASKIATSLKVI